MMAGLLQGMLLKMKIVNKFEDQRFRAMADQTVQVFESITYSLLFLIIIFINPFILQTNKKRRKRTNWQSKVGGQRVNEFDLRGRS